MFRPKIFYLMLDGSKNTFQNDCEPVILVTNRIIINGVGYLERFIKNTDFDGYSATTLIAHSLRRGFYIADIPTLAR